MRPAGQAHPVAKTTPPSTPRHVETMVIIQGRSHDKTVSLGVMCADKWHLIHFKTNLSVGFVFHKSDSECIFDIVSPLFFYNRSQISCPMFQCGESLPLQRLQSWCQERETQGMHSMLNHQSFLESQSSSYPHRFRCHYVFLDLKPYT